MKKRRGMLWMVVLPLLLGGFVGKGLASYNLTVYVKNNTGNALVGYWVRFTCTSHSPNVQTSWKQTDGQGKVSFNPIPGDHLYDNGQIEARDQLVNPSFSSTLHYTICHSTETKTITVNTVTVIPYYAVYPYAEPVGIEEGGMIESPSPILFSILLRTTDSVPDTVYGFRYTGYFDPSDFYVSGIQPDTLSGFTPTDIVIDNQNGWISYAAENPEGAEIQEGEDLPVAYAEMTPTVTLDPCYAVIVHDPRIEPYEPYPSPSSGLQEPPLSDVNGNPVIPQMTQFVFVGAAPPLPPGSFYIPNVPDWNQPPLSGSNNYCTPVAVLNILDYYQNVVGQVPGLVDPSDPLRYPSNSNTADLIGYFMDTNNAGSACRANGTTYPAAPGTYVGDQDTGLAEYIAWNAAGQFCAGDPAPPAWKIGYNNFTVIKDVQIGWVFYTNQVSVNNPVKIDFLHWNIVNTNQILVDPVTGDTFNVFQWGPPDTMSANPQEKWNLIDYPPDQNIGHAATGVGFIPNWNGQNWAIVHDNWAWTPKNIVIPWSNWVATVAIIPPPTEVSEERKTLSTKALEVSIPSLTRDRIRVEYILPESSGDFSITLYNASGRKVSTLLQARMQAGKHSLLYDLGNKSSGVYFLKVKAEHKSVVRRFLLIR